MNEKVKTTTQETIAKVLTIEATAISNLIPRVDDLSDRAVELLAECEGRVVVTGLGKSGIIARKLAATLASTGTPAQFVHPTEAVHGDLGMLARNDVALALSNSGETVEVLNLLDTIKRLGIPLISMVGALESTLAKNSDVAFDVGVDQEACPLGIAPTASTTAALALGDALAMALLERKGFRLEDFALLHPGGRLGNKLSRVRDHMHVEDRIPKVTPETPMRDVIVEMTSKGLGVTAVVDAAERLLGVISDGDLRRLLQHEENPLTHTADDCMTSNPVTTSGEELAAHALHIMEERKITSLMVVEPTGALVGVVHLHNLWSTGLV